MPRISVAGEIFAAIASKEFQPLDIILYSVSRILGGAVATMKDYDYCSDSFVLFKFSRTFFIDYSQRTRHQQTQRLIILHPSFAIRRLVVIEESVCRNGQ